MKFGIVVFPGSNCDRDMQDALQNELEKEVVMFGTKIKTLACFQQKIALFYRAGFLMVITCVAELLHVLAR